MGTVVRTVSCSRIYSRLEPGGHQAREFELFRRGLGVLFGCAPHTWILGILDGALKIVIVFASLIDMRAYMLKVQYPQNP